MPGTAGVHAAASAGVGLVDTRSHGTLCGDKKHTPEDQSDYHFHAIRHVGRMCYQVSRNPRTFSQREQRFLAGRTLVSSSTSGRKLVLATRTPVACRTVPNGLLMAFSGFVERSRMDVLLGLTR